MTDDFVLYSAKWIIEADPDKAEALARTRKYNEHLLKFLLGNDLIRSPEKWVDFDDWASFEIVKGDLTGRGFALFKACHDKWLSKIDRSGKVDMTIWERALKGMNQ